MSTKLTLGIIESFNLPKKQYKPDYDDAGYEFTLPNGIELSCLFMCNGQPCKSDMLEGLDGWICIDFKEELEELIKMSYGQVINKIADEHDDFHLNDYID